MTTMAENKTQIVFYTFCWACIFTILQVKKQLFNFQDFTWMNQFAFVDDFFSQSFNIRFLIQSLHSNSSTSAIKHTKQAHNERYYDAVATTTTITTIVLLLPNYYILPTRGLVSSGRPTIT